MRFIFTLLSFALCDVYAASNMLDDAEPLLRGQNRQGVWYRNVQPNGFAGVQYVLNAVPNMNMMVPTNNTCPSLFIGANREKLNNAAWETWIIEHAQLGISEYSAAIRQATVVRLADAEGWDCLYKNLVIDPGWIYRSLHSETMSVRKNFFDKVEQEARLQSFEVQLNQRVLMLENDRNALRQEFATLSSTSKEARITEPADSHSYVDAEIKKIQSQFGDFNRRFDETTQRFGAAIEGLHTQFDGLSLGVDELTQRQEQTTQAVLAGIEKLGQNKVGVNYMSKFACLVFSLVTAKERELSENRTVTLQEWRSIRADAEEKFKKN